MNIEKEFTETEKELFVMNGLDYIKSKYGAISEKEYFEMNGLDYEKS